MQELNIVLDARSSVHLYEQIYVYLRREITAGTIAEGEKLPSTRSLAASLHISRSTADLAYAQLLSEGYIRSKRGSGYYVCRVENLLPLEPSAQSGESHEERAKKERKSEERGKQTIDFSTRDIDMSCFPYPTWKRIQKSVMVGANVQMFSLGDPAGDESLRRTIARYLHFSRGVHCTAEQVVVGAGNDYLMMLLRLILGEKRRIGMENPTYQRAARIFSTLDWEVVPVRMDESGMSASALEESGCSAAYVMPAHQFPMGIVMPITRRMELLSWARREPDRYLIEDDYDSEFRYRGKPIPSLQSSDSAGCVIYMGTFSKAIAPAIRVSYMILPPQLLPVFRRQCGAFSCTVPRIDQAVLEQFLSGGHFLRYLNRMRTMYRGKHDLLLSLLRDVLPGWQVTGEGSGLHLLLMRRSFDGTADEAREMEESIVHRGLSLGVRVYGLYEFLMPELPCPEGQQRMPTLILGYGGLSLPQIREGLERCRRGLPAD